MNGNVMGRYKWNTLKIDGFFAFVLPEFLFVKVAFAFV